MIQCEGGREAAVVWVTVWGHQLAHQVSIETVHEARSPFVCNLCMQMSYQLSSGWQASSVAGCRKATGITHSIFLTVFVFLYPYAETALY